MHRALRIDRLNRLRTKNKRREEKKNIRFNNESGWKRGGAKGGKREIDR